MPNYLNTVFQWLIAIVAAKTQQDGSNLLGKIHALIFFKNKGRRSFWWAHQRPPKRPNARSRSNPLCIRFFFKWGRGSALKKNRWPEVVIRKPIQNFPQWLDFLLQLRNIYVLVDLLRSCQLLQFFVIQDSGKIIRIFWYKAFWFSCAQIVNGIFI